MKAAYKNFCCGLLLTCLNLSGSGQAVHTKHTSPATRKEIRSLLEESGRFPVEYQAAITFMVIDHTSTTLSSLQKERFLENLFSRAPNARYQSGLLYGGAEEQSLAHQSTVELHYSRLDRLDIQ